MGAIQNSINGALGSAAVAGRMISAEKESALAHGQKAADVAAQATDDIAAAKLAKPKLEHDKRLAEQEVFNIDREASNVGGEEGEELQKKAEAAHYSLEKATIALRNVKKEIRTKRALLKAQQETIQKGRAWGGNY